MLEFSVSVFPCLNTVFLDHDNKLRLQNYLCDECWLSGYVLLQVVSVRGFDPQRHLFNFNWIHFLNVNKIQNLKGIKPLWQRFEPVPRQFHEVAVTTMPTIILNHLSQKLFNIMIFAWLTWNYIIYFNFGIIVWDLLITKVVKSLWLFNSNLCANNMSIYS